jgi:hypothetical protein
MKKLLLSAIALIYASFLFGQGLRVLDEAGNDISFQTIHVWGDSGNVIVTSAHLQNTAGSGYKMVHAKRRVVNAYANSQNYFCMKYCYAPSTAESPEPDSVYANQVYTKFHGYFDPANQSGTGTISYLFWDANNIADSTSFTIIYHADATGLKNVAVTGENKISAPAPNPASSFASFNYSLKSNVQNAKISMYNMLGALVKEITLEDQQGTLKIPTSELKNGVYFYSLVADSKVITTKKLIVSH